MPYLEILRPIPAVAWIPLAILMMPTEESSIIYITFLGALFPIVLNTIHGVEQTPEVLVRAALTLGANRMQVFCHVIIPAAFPSIAAGLAIGMGVAWFSLLAGEIISGQYGIGYFTWNAYSLINYHDIVVGMLAIGVGGLEVALAIAGEGRPVTLDHVERARTTRALTWGRDDHYDVISAFIKSMRGSDPDAAIYYLARMIESGEDPLFIARRLVILASEDVGLADRHALPLAIAAQQSVHFIGMPEGFFPLVHATLYLATAPKSNTVGRAYGAALADVEETRNDPVPIHLSSPRCNRHSPRSSSATSRCVLPSSQFRVRPAPKSVRCPASNFRSATCPASPIPRPSRGGKSAPRR